MSLISLALVVSFLTLTAGISRLERGALMIARLDALRLAVVGKPGQAPPVLRLP